MRLPKPAARLFTLSILAIAIAVASACTKENAHAERTPLAEPASPNTAVARAEGTSPPTRARYVNYIANGYAKTPTESDKRYGKGEMRFFNPSERRAKIDIEVHFEAKPPVSLKTLTIDPLSNGILLIFPATFPEVFTDAGPWGMKIVSDEPMIVDHFSSAGVMKDADDFRFRGGVSNVLGQPRASRLWYFGDGILIDTNPAKGSFPWDEIEWYHTLNPGPRPAEVKMHCYYHDGNRETFTYTVAPERVMKFSNDGLVNPGIGYGIKFVSSEPVVIQSERLILGSSSVDEWGMHYHNPRPGVPAPLAINEDID